MKVDMHSSQAWSVRKECVCVCIFLLGDVRGDIIYAYTEQKEIFVFSHEEEGFYPEDISFIWNLCGAAMTKKNGTE